tara:strand:- start:97 stop:417 length:321 start_codon:yes stop_codon:yes gene_type:complete
MINPKWGDQQNTVIHTDDGMSIPAVVGNSDYDFLVANSVSIADWVAPEKTWAEIRGERDALLKASDWMAMPDRTMSDAQSAYRQGLRDIPQDFADPASVIWPTIPE